MKRIVALTSRQGTACPETALYDDEDTPGNRAAVEAGISNTRYSEVDEPLAGTWTDVSGNSYFGSDVERIVESIGRTDMSESRMWEVRVPVTVTADDEAEAIKFALDDLRDPDMEWDTFEVQQTSGPHVKVQHGLCPVCGHYGDDCEGTA